MEKVTFSKNWNKKLGCDFFTAIRLPANKYIPGTILKVVCKEEWIYNAQVIHSREVMINKLTDYDTLTDAGMNRTDFAYMMKKMYPTFNFEKYPVVVLMLKRLEYSEEKEILENTKPVKKEEPKRIVETMVTVTEAVQIPLY